MYNISSTFNKLLNLLFVATMRCCTSRLRICNPNTSSTFYWSWGKEQHVSSEVFSCKVQFKLCAARSCSSSPISSSHLIASAHRELPVKGSLQAVAQVDNAPIHGFSFKGTTVQHYTINKSLPPSWRYSYHKIRIRDFVAQIELFVVTIIAIFLSSAGGYKFEENIFLTNISI